MRIYAGIERRRGAQRKEEGFDRADGTNLTTGASRNGSVGPVQRPLQDEPSGMAFNMMVRDPQPTRMRRETLRRAYLRSIGNRPFEGSADPRLAAAAMFSVDAFDTLITRSVLDPADVFLICGIELRERRMIAVDPPVWSAGRQRAESTAAAAAMPEEASLEAIYDRLVSEGLIDRHAVAGALAIEEKAERAVSRPIAVMIHAVDSVERRGGEWCVMSDTCMPHAALCGLLTAAGLTLRHDRVFTSSQNGATKRAGGLFAAALAQLNVDSGDVLHVGDNLESDLRRAKASGLPAAPYIHGRLNRMEHCLWSGLHGDPVLASVMAGSARATRLSQRFPDVHQQAIWDTSADFSGPLLFSYVAWLLREAVRLELRCLYFFSRDGEILIKIARVLQPHLASNLDCRYLLASRKSLHLPAIAAFGPAEKEWMLDHGARRSLRNFLARLDIELDVFLALLPPASALQARSPDVPLGDAGVALLARVIERPAFQRLVLARAAPLRADCLSYMESERLFDPGVIGIVDIGWRGRLQRSLVKILSTREPEIHRRLHGFYIDLENPPDDAGHLSVFSALCGPTPFRWSKRGPLFEIICAAHHGTVKRYRMGSLGYAEPELASPSNPAAEGWGLAIQQEAVVAFAREACGTFRLTGLNPLDHIGPLAKAILALTRLFVEYPSRTEAECFGRFAHTENEEHENAAEIAGVIDFHPVALRHRFHATTRHRRISFWPEASIARSVSPWLRQTALHALRWMPGRRA